MIPSRISGIHCTQPGGFTCCVVEGAGAWATIEIRFKRAPVLLLLLYMKMPIPAPLAGLGDISGPPGEIARNCLEKSPGEGRSSAVGRTEYYAPTRGSGQASRPRKKS